MGRGRSSNLTALALAAMLGVTVVAGCGVDDTSTQEPSPSASSTPSAAAQQPAPSPVATVPSGAPSASAVQTPGEGTALALLSTLDVKGRAPKTGYSRDLFGPAWADIDRNGCDTRNDMLRRDLDPVYVREGTHGCVVVSGELDDPYTGQHVEFVRGQDTSGEVQIDHVVALMDSWQKGAATRLTPAQRAQFGNDPLNLIPTIGSVNAAKGAGDAATWLPPDQSFRCEYVARQISVKAAYDLWVTGAERDAMVRVLSTCPTQGAVTRAQATQTVAEPVEVPATTAPARTTAPPAPVAPGLDPQFSSCRKAIDAGYGPYVQGSDPEYDWYRDADHDGIVCE